MSNQSVENVIHIWPPLTIGGKEFYYSVSQEKMMTMQDRASWPFAMGGKVSANWIECLGLSLNK